MAGDEQGCKNAMFVEGGKFLGASYSGYKAAALSGQYAMRMCVAIGVATGGTAGVLCGGLVIGVGAFMGTKLGSAGGEWAGELLYETVVE